MNNSTTSRSRIYIYALIDPRTSEPRYIGKTNNPQKRFAHHLNPRKEDMSYRANWIRSLQRLGLQPTVMILEETDESQWPARERWWVAYGIKEGWRLTNGDSGGSGGKKPTPETVEKLRVSHSGYKHTPEAKGKLSLAMRGRKASEATKEKLRKREHTWGHKISAGKMGHDVNDESRAKMSQRKREHWDKMGRKVDIVIAHLQANPQDAQLSCRALAKLLGVKHDRVSEAKRQLGYSVKQFRYNKMPG